MVEQALMSDELENCLIVSGDIVSQIGCNLLDLIGYSGQEIVGKSVGSLFKMLRVYGLDENTGTSCTEETFLFTKSLEVRFVKIEYRHLINKDKKIYIIDEIPNSRIENKFPFFHKLLIDNRIGLAIYSVPDFAMLQANQCYLDYIDSPFNEKSATIGQRRADIFQTWHGSSLEAIFNKVVETGETHMESEFMNLDFFERGITYWQFSLTPMCEDGKVKYIIFYISDVTDDVKARQLLKQQKEEIKVIMDNISDAIIVIDKEGNYIHSNKVAKEYLSGINLSKMGDMQPHIRVMDSSKNILPVEELPFVKALRGEAIKDELYIAKGRDEEIYLNVNAVPIYQEEEIDMVIGCCTDITEHLKHEEVIRRHQELLLDREKEQNNILINSMRMKDEFLSLVSHEFKTPLNVILSAVQVMESLCKDELSDRMRKYIYMIKQNSYRQLRLVNNLLDITKVNAGHIKLNKSNRDIVIITEYIIESVSLYAEQKNVNIRFHSNISKLNVGIDEEKYERILLNLLSNAIKFTPAGKGIEVRIYQDDQELCIQVIDQVLGIPKDKQEMIFERFGQVDSSLSRQAEGTGIGLFLVKQFVNVLGGRLSLCSEVGEGSTFTIIFPLDKLAEVETNAESREIVEERLVGAIKTEFSDIYF